MAVKARLVDVAPTILEIAGVPVPSQMQGQSLLRIARTNADQPVYSSTDFPQRAFGWSALESWRAGKYLYIKAPRPELYDLSADPGAAHNLAQTSKATLETIAGQLDAFDRRFSDSGNASSGPQLTSSEMQKLASLGYVGLQKSSAAASAAAGVDPKDGIASANKILSALAVLNDGKPEKAVALLQPLLATGSKMYLVQFVMGAALARQQQYPQAIEYLRRAIELQPDSTWAHYEMGSSLLKTGDYKTAVVHLEIVSSRLPEFAEGHTPSGSRLTTIWAGPRRRSANAPIERRHRSRNPSVYPLNTSISTPISLNNAIMSITLVDLWESFRVYCFPMVTSHISTPCTYCCRCTCCSRRGHGDGM